MAMIARGCQKNEELDQPWSSLDWKSTDASTASRASMSNNDALKTSGWNPNYVVPGTFLQFELASFKALADSLRRLGMDL